MKLRKEVKRALIIAFLIVGFIALFISAFRVTNRDREAIENCTRQTKNRAFCEAEFFGR